MTSIPALHWRLLLMCGATLLSVWISAWSRILVARFLSVGICGWLAVRIWLAVAALILVASVLLRRKDVSARDTVNIVFAKGKKDGDCLCD